MRAEVKSSIIIIIYTLIMVIICSVMVFAMKKNQDNNQMSLEESEIITTDVIYVPVYIESFIETDSTTTIESESISDFLLIAKEYEGRIGLFTADGDLIRVLEVNIKTLPIADRRMLEEGIEITDEAKLRAIIEDYMG